MSAPIMVLTIGASLSIGVVAVSVSGSVLSKPITGEVVPTRITDLAGYLVGSGGKGLGVSDVTDVLGLTIDGQDPDTGQSVGTVDNSPAARAGTSPTVKAPPSGVQGPPPPTVATPDSKRMLAIASFATGLVVAFGAFVLIRRVIQ